MTGTLSERSVIFYYAVGKRNTISVKHNRQKGLPSNYEIASYPTKSEKLISENNGYLPISQEEFMKATQKASDRLNAMIEE